MDNETAEVLHLLETRTSPRFPDLTAEELLIAPDSVHYGTIREVRGSEVRYGGNFWGLSRAFHITTSDLDVIGRMDAAIRAHLDDPMFKAHYAEATDPARLFPLSGLGADIDWSTPTT